MLGVVGFLICLLAFLVGMELRSPGTVHAVVEAGTLVWMTASQHVDAEICSSLTTLGRPIAACAGL
jgi:hypothetical protein